MGGGEKQPVKGVVHQIQRDRVFLPRFLAAVARSPGLVGGGVVEIIGDAELTDEGRRALAAIEGFGGVLRAAELFCVVVLDGLRAFDGAAGEGIDRSRVEEGLGDERHHVIPVAGIDGVVGPAFGETVAGGFALRVELGKDHPVRIDLADGVSHAGEERHHVIRFEADFPAVLAGEECLVHIFRFAIGIEPVGACLLEGAGHAVTPDGNPVLVGPLLALHGHLHFSRVKLHDGDGAGNAAGDQQAIQRRPGRAGHHALGMRFCFFRMLMAHLLADPAGARLVQRVEAQHMGHVLHAFGHLLHGGHIVLLQIGLGVEPVDLVAGGKILACEEQRPHDGIARAAVIVRPGHGRVIVLLPPAAARIVVAVLHHLGSARLVEGGEVEARFLEGPARCAVAAGHARPDVLVEIDEDI